MPTRVCLWLVLFPLLGGCDLTPSDVILDGKSCDSRGACVQGYVCDTRYNVCRQIGSQPVQQGDAQATATQTE